MEMRDLGAEMTGRTRRRQLRAPGSELGSFKAMVGSTLSSRPIVGSQSLGGVNVGPGAGSVGTGDRNGKVPPCVWIVANAALIASRKSLRRLKVRGIVGCLLPAGRSFMRLTIANGWPAVMLSKLAGGATPRADAISSVSTSVSPRLAT